MKQHKLPLQFLFVLLMILSLMVLFSGCFQVEPLQEYMPDAATQAVDASITTNALSSTLSTIIITPTMRLTKQIAFTEREPTLEQIKAYSTNFISQQLHHDFDRGVQCQKLDIGAYAVVKPCIIEAEGIYYTTFSNHISPSNYIARFTEVTTSFLDYTILYEDVSGDGVADLVVHSHIFVMVFVWQHQHYAPPFILLQDPYFTRSPSSSRTYLEDWTGDGSPEIIFDFLLTGTGTGFHGDIGIRHVIYCTNRTCQIKWHAAYSELIDDLNYGSLVSNYTNMNVEIDEHGTSTIQTYTEGFDISKHGWNPEFWSVFMTTSSLYSWQNDEFALIDKTIVTPAQTIHVQNVFTSANQFQPQIILTATNIMGVKAWVSANHNGNAGNQNGVCQLLIDEQPIGQEFGCKPNFTSLIWENIVGDDQPELVIKTVSAFTAWETYSFEKERQNDGEQGCLHQRLLIYQWDEANSMHDVANVAGCVVQSNLYGVHLADIDGDDQLEILASERPLRADNFDIIGYVDRVYVWNGSEFVFSDKINR